MSTRFFASVRRNQKQWMVVVTVLSMVSFLFLDDFGRGKGPMSAFGGALMIGTLCAAGMCIVGYPRQKTTEYGLGGFVVGFIAGFIGFGSVGANRPIVRTAVGNFTRADFQELASQRQKLNQFAFAAAHKRNTQTMGFGGIDDQDLLGYRVRLADAKKLGIQVTDERVNDYIKQLNLTQSEYLECLREARLGESELFEMLKSEFAAQLAIELTRAPAYVPPIPPQLNQYIAQFGNESPEEWRYMQETPQQLWQTFQKLTVKEKLQAVALPVREFVSQVPDPSGPELGLFFERFKNIRWTDEARPGFMQMPRVQLAYLTGDFEKFETGADPTDEDVQQYYEKNKEKYRAPVAKMNDSTAPKLPDGETEAPKAEAPKTDEPAEGTEKSEEIKKPGDSEKKSDEKKPPEDGAKENSNDKKSEDKKDDGAEKEKGADDKSATESKSNGNGDEDPEEPPAAKGAEDPKPKPANEHAESNAAAQSAPANALDPVNASSNSSIPNLSDSPESLPAPKYRELNDDLKASIRDEILRERAFVLIVAEVDKAYELMDTLRLEYDTLTDDAKKKEFAKSIAEKLKAFAGDHKLEYKETRELTYEELATEPIGNALEGKSRSPVLNEVFMPGARGEPRMPLYSPRHAELRSQGGAFVYWKIAEIPAQVSNLKDEEVHKLAVSAWKFDQARSFAEKRAKELAAKVKTEGNDLPAALSGESVTGVKTDPPVTIIPTDEFTWLTTNKSIPNASQGPMITAIPLIPNIADEFMRSVFDDIGEGETGVTVDEPKAIFYVVKVIEREGSKSEDGGVALSELHARFMQTEFASKIFPIIKSPYQIMARYPQLQIEQAWRKNFQQQHQVVWEDDALPARPRR